ncbi:type II secretion system protein [Leptolyngbya sp. FACHB-711]|uniref:type II secretion system protein n=1 Tax=Leptolyngbya sp. FACHB-711 TaxID=2692813 RepID=UPI001682991C|nr:type II secretion system protein [Leptolyngbya sp. FACHB-711]MBD2027471.1 type II secretion system protein [Leptolyngbya sp. FACHB-711]
MQDKQQGKAWTFRFANRARRPYGDGNRFTGSLAKPDKRGFTLVEMLIAISIAGILVAIAAPSWIQWRNTQRITAAQDQALQVMRQAQRRAMSSKLAWRVSFREVDRAAEWAIHPATATPTASHWQPFPAGVQIDTMETTLARRGGVYRVEFTYQGHVNPPLGRITFMAAGGSRAKRCVVVSTILGTMRKARDNRTADQGGRYCY